MLKGRRPERRKALWQRNAPQVQARRERVGPDFAHALRHGDFFYVIASAKRFVADAAHARREKNLARAVALIARNSDLEGHRLCIPYERLPQQQPEPAEASGSGMT